MFRFGENPAPQPTPEETPSQEEFPHTPDGNTAKHLADSLTDSLTGMSDHADIELAAAETPSSNSINRRAFLKMLGGAAAGAALGLRPEQAEAARGVDTRWDNRKINAYDKEYRAFVKSSMERGRTGNWSPETKRLNYKPSYLRVVYLEDRGKKANNATGSMFGIPQSPNSSNNLIPVPMKEIVDLAATYKMDLAMVFAIVAVESNWFVDPPHNSEARGLTQMHRAAAQEMGVDYDRLSADPVMALRGGFKYFLNMMDAAKQRFPQLKPEEHVGLALAIYNRGPNKSIEEITQGLGQVYMERLQKATYDYMTRFEENPAARQDFRKKKH